MQLEEVLHRINYFKGIFYYQHILPFFPEPISIQVKKPEIIQFTTEAYEDARIVFSCYSEDQNILWVEAIDIEPQTLQTHQTQRPKPTPNQQSPSNYYQTPEAFQAPITKKDTDAAYDSEMNPIAVKIAPGRWKMGHKIMNSDGRPVEFKKGYNPLRDELFDEFMCMQGYAYWEEDDEVWYVWNERPNGSKHPEIPEDSIYRPLEGLDPFQFPVASTIRKSYGRATPEQTYEETSQTTAEDIQVQRHYLRQHGKDPDKMGPAYALPKGVYDLPDDWVDPETAG